MVVVNNVATLWVTKNCYNRVAKYLEFDNVGKKPGILSVSKKKNVNIWNFEQKPLKTGTFENFSCKLMKCWWDSKKLFKRNYN